MADIEELLQEAQEREDVAEGLISDAEFREEHETRVIRYLHAQCNLLIGIFRQNEALLEVLREGDLGGLGG